VSKSSVPQLPKLSKPGASRRQMTLPPPVALPDPTLKDRLFNGLAHFGEAWNMTIRAVRVTFHRPFEWREIMAQINSLGIASLGIVFVTSTFIGMVMSAQFAFGLQKFGGMEYTGRVVAISFARELAPTLTAVIVGGRIGAGMTAELGAMAVTEQIDAIQALGADPIKKLVAPRLVASTLVMPILGSVALVLGFSGAMLITDLQFGIPAPFFLGSSLSQLRISDYFLGLLKTPVFGAITAIVACHYGLRTRGGTAGVGQNTTLTVVVTSIGILVADLVLTKLGFTIFGML
jgi:phospholipid/cholesterol/gamma-HCH transport system permease protein